MTPVLEVRGLCKTYPNFALTDVSFTLPDGCVTGFIGANGAGKTTTIHTILGLARREGGTVKLFGKEFDGRDRALKDRLGVVFDDGGFYDQLSMAEMTAIVAPAYRSWSPSDYRTHMERFGLDPKQKISTLSKGMKMKYALALALSHRAELLVMDEPTGGLDPLVRAEFLDILVQYMKDGGRGVFFSTHITSDLDKIADTLVLMDKGRILFERERDDLLDGHRKVKGDARSLTPENRKLFLDLRVSDYGFTGLTSNPQAARAAIPGLLMERPTIEDVMLAYVERREG